MNPGKCCSTGPGLLPPTDSATSRGAPSCRPDGSKIPRLEVTVIREGFSANFHRPGDPEWYSRRHKYRRYYTAKAVEDVAEAVNGKPVFVGNPTAHGAPRTLKDNVVGVFTNGRIEEANGRKVARAEIQVYPDQTWIIDRARVNKKAFGPSIEGDGPVRKGIMEGRDAAIVEGVTELDGALLVLNPAAGGALDRILESQQPQTRRGERKMLGDLNEAERDEVMREARKLVEAEVDYKAKDAEIAALKESVKKLEDEKKAAAATLAEAKSKELLEAAFPKDLPQVAKNALYESCKGETDPAKITEAVKKMAAFVAEVSGGTVVTGAAGKTEIGKLAESKDLVRDALNLPKASDAPTK